MYNDTVSDFITQLRNANAAQKETVMIRSSKIVKAIADVLRTSGFVANIAVDGYNLAISLNSAMPLNHIKRLSKPGLRRYVKTSEIPVPFSGLGTVILSTPKGVMTGHQAKKQKVGGELICEVW